ncbi:MAG: sulfatase [Jejuia sp.]
MLKRLTDLCMRLFLILCTLVVYAQDKPNIVLVIIDDMGWKDMSCSGSAYYETPNIDKMANEGMRFTKAYSAAPVCAPSRGAIFTGKNPARTKFTTVFNGKAAPDDRLYEVSKKRDGGNNNQYYEALHRHNIPKNEVFFAHVLKDNGYATGFFGKWHCGIHPDYIPENRGFDVAIGYRNKHVPTAVSGHWGKTFKSYGVGLQHIEDDQYIADVLTNKCISFIERNNDKPFLAVLSHYLVHNPIQAKPELVGHFKNKTTTDQDNPEYAAMLASVDESIGRLNEKLKQLGLDENTIVVFTSDNGGLNRNTSNYPLLGGKSYAFEAAMRVPLIVKWPKVVAPNQIANQRIVGMDFYPTFLEIAGVELIPEQHSDGESFLNILNKKPNHAQRCLVFHFPHYTGSTSPYSSIIEDDYKLIHFYNDEAGKYLLFNLKNDPYEQNDLSNKKPKLIENLALKLDLELNKMQAELPIINPNYQVENVNSSNLKSTYNKANKERDLQLKKLKNE